MKLELILLTVLALAGTTLFFQGNTTLQASNEDSVYAQYVQWKSAHGQNTNGREDEYRFTVFSENLKLVQAFNAINNFRLGVENQFAAMTNEEFRAFSTNQVIRDNQPTIKASNEESAAPTNASDINWVTKGAVNSVKDQGQCGSCWAFSAVSQLEGWFQISGNGLQNFSDQQVTSCTPQPSMGCNGGFPEGAMQYAASNGLMQNSAYPYVSGNTRVTGTCNYDASDATKGINTGYGNVTPNNPAALLAQLQIQPISILVDAANIVFQLYQSGVVDNAACGSSLDHAISLVAYSTSGATDGVWTVRNSWGAVWGMQGYMQIAYTTGNGYCGINMSPSYPTGN